VAEEARPSGQAAHTRLTAVLTARAAGGEARERRMHACDKELVSPWLRIHEHELQSILFRRVFVEKSSWAMWPGAVDFCHMAMSEDWLYDFIEKNFGRTVDRAACSDVAEGYACPYAAPLDCPRMRTPRGPEAGSRH
jgi:hypothetical protein